MSSEELVMVSSFRFAVIGLGLGFSSVTGCALVYSFSDYTAGTGGAAGSTGHGGAGGHGGTASQSSSGSNSSSGSGSPSSSSVSSTGSSSSASASSSGGPCMMDPVDPVDGDCHKPVCMNGVVVTIVDDTDAPPKMDDLCIQPVCTLGVIKTQPVPNGSACMEIGGSGQCCMGLCTTKQLCNDGCRNFMETDIDCGGTTCPGCAPGKKCMTDGDCTSGKCELVTKTCM